LPLTARKPITSHSRSTFATLRRRAKIGSGTSFKEYATPKGTIRQVVRQTEDYPHGDEVLLLEDHNIPRSKTFPVEEPEDIEKLPFLFFPPDDGELADFHDRAQAVRREANRRGLIVMGCCGGFGDCAAWLMGITNLIMTAVDRPRFVHRLLDTILEWEMREIDILLNSGVVDVVIHRGWYESSELWSPSLHREFLAGRLAKKASTVHQAGKKFGYIMSTGFMSLLGAFRDIGLDLLIHVDPLARGADLTRLKREAGDTICFRGGVNSAITLGRGSRDEIEDAVTLAVSTLAPGGGLVLSAADCLFSWTPWPAVRTMIDRWREIASYPIRI